MRVYQMIRISPVTVISEVGEYPGVLPIEDSLEVAENGASAGTSG